MFVIINCSWFLVNKININVQKQPPEVFYVNRCSLKFHKIHKKTPVPESLDDFYWMMKKIQVGIFDLVQKYS